MEWPALWIVSIIYVLCVFIIGKITNKTLFVSIYSTIVYAFIMFFGWGAKDNWGHLDEFLGLMFFVALPCICVAVYVDILIREKQGKRKPAKSLTRFEESLINDVDEMVKIIRSYDSLLPESLRGHVMIYPSNEFGESCYVYSKAKHVTIRYLVHMD